MSAEIRTKGGSLSDQHQNPAKELHPVAEALRARAQSATGGVSRDDGYRIGLAVEGGGMRGVISGAMLTALLDLGMRDVFDVVYGSSAGAINAVYFLAGETSSGLSLYFEDLATPAFFNLARALRGQPPMSLDFVFETLEDKMPVVWDVILNSTTPLHILVSDITEGRAVTLSSFSDVHQLKIALRAGACLPLIAGPPVELNGHRYLDAGVLHSHPFRVAIDDGCTHVLSLSTRSLRNPPTLSRRERLLSWHLERLRPGLRRLWLQRMAQYREDHAFLTSGLAESSTKPFILNVSPPETAPPIARLERDTRKLLAAARESYTATFLSLLGKAITAVMRLTESGQLKIPVGGQESPG